MSATGGSQREGCSSDLIGAECCVKNGDFDRVVEVDIERIGC